MPQKRLAARPADSEFYGFPLDATGVDSTLLTSFNAQDIRIGESSDGGWQFGGDIDFVRVTAGALAPE